MRNSFPVTGSIRIVIVREIDMVPKLRGCLGEIVPEHFKCSDQIT